MSKGRNVLQRWLAQKNLLFSWACGFLPHWTSPNAGAAFWQLVADGQTVQGFSPSLITIALVLTRGENPLTGPTGSSPPLSLWWEGNLCCAAPVLSSYCLKFWHGDTMISIWAADGKRHKPPCIACSQTSPGFSVPPSSHRSHSAICKALQKINV